MRIPSRITVFLLGTMVSAAATVRAQTDVARLVASPAEIVMTVGQTVPLSITAYDANGNVVSVPIRMGGPRQALRVTDGSIVALEAGSFEVVAIAAVSGAGPEGNPPSVTIPVTIRWPAVRSIDVTAGPGTLYAGTTLPHYAVARHADGSARPEAEVRWSTSDPSVAIVDAFGFVTARHTGRVTVTAALDGATARVAYNVTAFPAASLEIMGGESEVRTGDVQQFEAAVRDPSGNARSDVPIIWSYTFQPAIGILAPSGPGQIESGRFVADVPGVYTAIASAGPLSARKSFRVTERDVVQRVQVVGQGRQSGHYTSDVWPFEGVDGRDYALTGARQAQSHAFVWDITDPSNVRKVDSIQVDARSVNDVKVSPDGRYGVISREGASNRRNGVVILDLSNPAHPTVASTFEEGLTGGVHNVFATNDYLFAISGGDKYVILDMRDLANPRFVSEYNHPDSRIHDLWVHDGLAYSAEWQTGVVVVDVGNGRWGGTIEAPRLVTVVPIPTGSTHAVFPYHQESTGKFYLFVGDEITNRRGLAWEGTGPDVRMPFDPESGRGGYPRATSGYIQIVDFTDPENARMVARYEVTEFGTHNIWVEDDKLYQAYYEGGLRVVDVSGELMGNLYTQGREIAVYKAHDPIGWIANAPAAWGAFPYKGNIIFSDISSGVWVVKLEPKERAVS